MCLSAQGSFAINIRVIVCGFDCNLEKTCTSKGGVIRATKLLQLATKSDFNAC
jgi:hypothetical protein